MISSKIFSCNDSVCHKYFVIEIKQRLYRCVSLIATHGPVNMTPLETNKYRVVFSLWQYLRKFWSNEKEKKNKEKKPIRKTKTKSENKEAKGKKTKKYCMNHCEVMRWYNKRYSMNQRGKWLRVGRHCNLFRV